MSRSCSVCVRRDKAETLLRQGLSVRRIATEIGVGLLAILMGEGFSVFYQDADDRVWTRIAGVVIGLSYVALVIAASRRLTRPAALPAQAPAA